MSKVYAYLRSSKDTTDLDNQKSKIEDYCKKNDLSINEIIEDPDVSGYKIAWEQRKIHKLITESTNKDDTVVIFDITRLARKMRDIHEISTICYKRKVNLIDVVQGIEFKYNEKSIQKQITNTVMLSVLAMASEIERLMISERTKASLDSKKRNIENGNIVMKKTENNAPSPYQLIGVCGAVRVIEDDKGDKKQVLRKGTKYKSKFDQFKDQIIEGLKNGLKQKEIADSLELNPSSLSKYIKNHQLSQFVKKNKKTKKDISKILKKNKQTPYPNKKKRDEIEIEFDD
jgi:DNA invertase Pin-like site-specific DNA recombinase